MHLLVTRPQADAHALAVRLGAAGHTAILEPLLEIEPADTRPIDITGVQAVIATSRNGLRVLAQQDAISRLRRLPLLAVGPGTAALARSLGFEVVVAGPAASRDLARLARATFDPTAGMLLHLAGEIVAQDLSAELSEMGFTVIGRVVYRARAMEQLTPATVQALHAEAIDGVILMSPRTATIYARLIQQQQLSGVVGNIVHFCLSSSVAAPLDTLGALKVATAVQPKHGRNACPGCHGRGTIAGEVLKPRKH